MGPNNALYMTEFLKMGPKIIGTRKRMHGDKIGKRIA